VSYNRDYVKLLRPPSMANQERGAGGSPPVLSLVLASKQSATGLIVLIQSEVFFFIKSLDR